MKTSRRARPTLATAAAPEALPYRDSDLSWRTRPRETERQAVLMGMLPGGESVLDIGARDGHYSLLLTRKYRHVTSLDLEKPAVRHPQVTCVRGNVTALEFPDRHFDAVFCAEVLEHVPDVKRAAAEIRRVARRDVVIGVPFEQDLRAGRMQCRHCRTVWNAWKHLHAFTQQDVIDLFPGCGVERVSFAGSSVERSNPISAALMRAAGYPWGTYHYEEPCSCGAKLTPPDVNLAQRACASLSYRLELLQRRFLKAKPDTINVLFSV